MPIDDAAAPHQSDDAHRAQVMDAPPDETVALDSMSGPEAPTDAEAAGEYDLLTVPDESEADQPAVASDAASGSGARQAVGAMWAHVRADLRNPSQVRYSVLLTISVIALLVSLLDFGLITGALRIPTPGLQTSDSSRLMDRATYGFEYDTEGWQARGAATSAVWNNIHTFAGQGALEVQVVGLTQKNNGFVFITAPPTAKPGSTVVAHVYAPVGTPPLVVTLYALDGSWAWSSGPYPSVKPGAWTAITYTIPSTLPAPVREMGVMLVGDANGVPFSGVIFVDSVNVQN